MKKAKMAKRKIYINYKRRRTEEKNNYVESSSLAFPDDRTVVSRLNFGVIPLAPFFGRVSRSDTLENVKKIFDRKVETEISILICFFTSCPAVALFLSRKIEAGICYRRIFSMEFS